MLKNGPENEDQKRAVVGKCRTDLGWPMTWKMEDREMKDHFFQKVS